MSRANEPVHPMLAASQNVATGETTQYQYCASMTIREHFAAMAMQGLCAHPETDGQLTPSDVAYMSMKYADALIAELAKVNS